MVVQVLPSLILILTTLTLCQKHGMAKFSDDADVPNNSD